MQTRIPKPHLVDSPSPYSSYARMISSSQVLTWAPLQMRNAPLWAWHKHKWYSCHQAHCEQLIRSLGNSSRSHAATREGGIGEERSFSCLPLPAAAQGITMVEWIGIRKITQKTSLNYVYESRDPEGHKRKRAGFQTPWKTFSSLLSCSFFSNW